MNVLKPHLQTTIWTLLAAGASQREIERVTGIDRKTIRSYQKRFAAAAANSPRMGYHAEGGGRPVLRRTGHVRPSCANPVACPDPGQGGYREGNH